MHMVVDRGILGDLIKTIGPDTLLALLEEGLLSASYSRTQTGVMTETVNFVPHYGFASIKLEKHADKKKIRTADEVRETVERALGVSAASKKITRRLLDRFEFRDVGLGNSKDSSEVASEELADSSRLANYVKTYLNYAVPSFTLPPTWEFRFIKKDDQSGRFYVMTDLDFDGINRQYHKSVSPTHSSISPEYIMSHILDAKIDVDLASNYMSEVITSQLCSDLIRVRFKSLLIRRDISLRDIELFQTVTLRDAHAVREAINSGERSFAEFLPILKRAHRFKQWLAGRNPDAILLNDYYQSIVVDGWVNKLPVKALRYVFTTFAGLANLGAGLAVGAADEFVVDKVLKGWRPNQFVDGPLKKFVDEI
ncbi:MAG: hypothetical protein WDN04_09360 [Rhodospirillales bacterium]